MVGWLLPINPGMSTIRILMMVVIIIVNDVGVTDYDHAPGHNTIHGYLITLSLPPLSLSPPSLSFSLSFFLSLHCVCFCLSITITVKGCIGMVYVPAHVKCLK